MTHMSVSKSEQASFLSVSSTKWQNSRGGDKDHFQELMCSKPICNNSFFTTNLPLVSSTTLYENISVTSCLELGNNISVLGLEEYAES